MLFSLEWLRSLCPVDAGLAEIAAALTARGLTVDATEERAGDHALDVDVPANRGDCLGHLGLARELAAAFALPLEDAPAAPDPAGETVERSVRVEIDAADLCSRYTARIARGVRVGPSPAWVVRRLETCGLRSVNNVVDASNLVMLQLGNPIHFFDLERLRDATIRVRRAAGGERLTTLDGLERVLEPEMLVIADARRPIALAGVIGGADTEIGLSTREVLIEAAWFEPRAVRRTARGLGLRTDASHRFERGVDIRGVEAAQRLALRLLDELSDARPAPGMIDAYPKPWSPRELSLRHSELGRLLGYRPSPDTVVEALRSLHLAPVPIDHDRVTVRVPSWRGDLAREVDLVEEAARHLGYDAVPTSLDGLPTIVSRADQPRLGERARDVLAAAGFHEAVGYAMIGEDEDTPFLPDPAPTALRLTNPIAETLACLRRSVLPGLLRAADVNQRRGTRDLRLFEVGRVFLAGKGGEFPREPLRAGIAWGGAGRPRHWSEADRAVDLQDIMGLVEHVFATLRPGMGTRRRPGAFPGMHPGLSATWLTGDGRPIAWAGALHPRLAEGLQQAVFLAEIDLRELGAEPAPVPQYRSLPRLREVARDLSLVLRRDPGFDRILAVLESVDPPVPVRFEVLDRYEGPPLAPDEVSLTVRAVLRPHDRTLTDHEIEGYRQRLVDELGARLGIGVRDA